MNTTPLPEQPVLLPEVNLRDYMDIIRRRKLVFLQVFGLVLGMGLLGARSGKPIYQTHAKLLVSAGSNAVSIIDSNNPIAAMLAAAQPYGIETQMQLMQSGPFLADAFRAARVVSKPDIIPPSVGVETVEGTNILQINVTGGDPQQIADLANKIAQLHLERTKLSTTTGLDTTVEFVRQEKQKAEKQLADVEDKILAFRKAHRGVDLSTERAARAGEYTALLARVLELKSNIVTTRAQVENLRAQLRKEPVEVIQESTRENPRLTKLQDRLGDLKQQRLDLLREFRPSSRPIADLDQRIAGLEKQMAAEPAEIRTRVHSSNLGRTLLQNRWMELQAILQGHEQNYGAAAAEFSAKKGMLDSLGPWEAELGRLNRDRDAVQGAYTMMADRLRELEIRTNAQLQTARQIEMAPVPTAPLQHSSSKNIALAVILALLLAVSTVLMQEYLDDRVREPEELERIASLRTMAYVPLMAADQPRLLASLGNNSQMAEAYRTLRASIGFAAFDGPIRRLQITSASQGEGKSTTSANLATAMARDGKRVILIDADLRSPSVHRLLGAPLSPGLSEVLAGMATLDAVLQPTEIENLRIISAGSIPPNPAELLSSRAFEEVIEQLDQRADVLIFDTPPCVPVIDPALVAGRMDAVILVLQVGETRRGSVKQTIELLRQTRTRVLGVVFNQVRPHARGYYYSHYDYDRYGYGPESAERNGRHRRNGKTSQNGLENGKAMVAAPSRANDEDG
jgi:succinoglycan biosynthesis transport protein ExoP